MEPKHVILAVGILVACLSCEKNPAPTIISMNANPESVFPRDTLILTCEYTDEGSLSNHFEWLCPFGELYNPNYPTGTTFNWIAPSTPGQYYITLSLDDDENITKDSLLVTVLDTLGSFVDPRDNHEYKWVKIGQQIWMAENLAYLPSVNHPSMVSVEIPFLYVYSYSGIDPNEAKTRENYLLFGTLYNWAAAMTACPRDWHLPSDEEWKELELRLGMTLAEIGNYTEKYWRNTGEVGKKLKSDNLEFNGDNSSGFNALPAGGVSNENNFWNINMYVFFWSSSVGDSEVKGINRYLNNKGDGVGRLKYSRRYGFSVRCIKDE